LLLVPRHRVGTLESLLPQRSTNIISPATQTTNTDAKRGNEKAAHPPRQE
jgi:hypothetical protein